MWSESCGNASAHAQSEGLGAAEQLNKWYAACEVLVAVSAVIGNALVILVFWREKKLRRRTKYYIISLAVADFLVGLVGIPFAILASVGHPKYFRLCLFTVSLLVVFCTISIFCLVAVSVDRYWAILHPMSYSRSVTSKTTVGIIVVCWVLGACVGFLPLMGWNRGEDAFLQCRFTCVMDYNYLVFLYFATIIFPALVLAGFYAHIYTVVRHQLRRSMLLCPGDSSNSRSSGVMLHVLGASQKREVKTTQNLSIIVLFFIVCWMPLYTLNAIQRFCEDCTVPPELLEFFIILSHLNSSFNPFLYAYHLKDFRKALGRLIPWKEVGKISPRKPAMKQRPRKGVAIGVQAKAVAKPHFGADFSNFVYIDGEEETRMMEGSGEGRDKGGDSTTAENVT